MNTIPDPHALYQRDLGDGIYIAVYPMTFGKARLCLCDGINVWNGYCYAVPVAAIAAAQQWDGESDPADGWHRHVDSGRRRENGDPTKEIVRW